MKYMSIFVTFITSLALLGCNRAAHNPISTPSPPPQVSPVVQDSAEVSTSSLDLLLDDQCNWYLWQDLTLNQTNATQALWWLEHNPMILTFRTSKIRENGRQRVISVHGDYRVAVPSQLYQEVGFGIYFSAPPGNTVESIAVSPKNPFTLGDLIKRCGEPSEVIAFISPAVDTPKDYWSTYLWWEERGLFVGTINTLERNAIPPDIDENFRLDFLEMKSPFAELNAPSWQTFFPWQGYQAFDYYEVVNPI